MKRTPESVFDYRVPDQGLTQGISRNEVKVGISRMKTGKSSGIDGILVEVRKCLGEQGNDMLWDMVQRIYQQEKIPMDSVIVPIWVFV